MAWMTQEHKKEIGNNLKKHFCQSAKFSLSVRHNSTRG